MVRALETMLSFLRILLIGIAATVLLPIPVICFNLNEEATVKKYLVLQSAYFECKNFNAVNKKNTSLNVHQGQLFCDEDSFCHFFLFHTQNKEIRLCYDNSSFLRKATYDDEWITGVKESVFENFSPNEVNAQGICNHGVDKYFFDTLHEAIEKRKEKEANFLVINFQPHNKDEKQLEAYFCESLKDIVDRDGYVTFDFTKLDKPHESCLKVKKCGLRGGLIFDMFADTIR